MPAYMKKTKSEVLSQAIEKLQKQTNITSIGPGSIARALVESITSEIGDLYDILDFNIDQTYLSTATGSALDAIGALYGVERKTISELAAIDKSLGAFVFYVQTTQSFDIVIPQGTNILTSATSFVGRQHSFSTTAPTIIPAGRTRAYAGIVPNFVETVYSAGINTLTFHDAGEFNGVTVHCTNPKVISPLPGYETDDNFRLRIIKQIRVSAAGTAEAVRFAGLTISNVRDVKIRQVPYGLGSFEAVIVPERVANADQVVAEAKAAMDLVRPLGIRMFTKTPTLLPMDINVEIFMPGVGSSTIVNSVTSRVEVGVRRYIQSLLPGSQFVYNRLIQVALDSSDSVKDVSISSLTINGSPQLSKNYQPKDDEQLVSGNIVVNIASS